MKSSSATALAATAWANRQAAVTPPSLTALRNAKNAWKAAMIRLIAPHAAISPWMIVMTAPAAGTISETTFSMTSPTIIMGSAATTASHAIRTIWAIDMQPLTSASKIAVPRPRMLMTFSSNHCLTAVFSADPR